MSEVARHVRREVWTGAFDVEMHHTDALKIRLTGTRDHRVEKDRRRGGCAVDVDVVAALDGSDGLFRTDETHREDSTP
jgi:hypothetical protein